MTTTNNPSASVIVAEGGKAEIENPYSSYPGYDQTPNWELFKNANPPFYTNATPGKYLLGEFGEEEYKYKLKTENKWTTDYDAETYNDLMDELKGMADRFDTRIWRYYIGKPKEAEQKFEVCEKSDGIYGVWNNDMQAWQFVDKWSGTSTEDMHDAIEVCLTLNAPKEATSERETDHDGSFAVKAICGEIIHNGDYVAHKKKMYLHAGEVVKKFTFALSQPSAKEQELREALEAFVKSCYTGCSKDELDQLRIKAEQALSPDKTIEPYGGTKTFAGNL